MKNVQVLPVLKDINGVHSVTKYFTALSKNTVSSSTRRVLFYLSALIYQNYGFATSMSII